jgi:hypothetical protein
MRKRNLFVTKVEENIEGRNNDTSELKTQHVEGMHNNTSEF